MKIRVVKRRPPSPKAAFVFSIIYFTAAAAQAAESAVGCCRRAGGKVFKLNWSRIPALAGSFHDYTTMIFAGSLHAPITPLRPAVRTRTHTVVPGALMLLLQAKAIREEPWLRERYPEYRDYEKRVKRFVPWVS